MNQTSPNEKAGAFRYVVPFLVVVLAAVLLYSVRSIWHPVVLLLLLLFLCYPYRDSELVKRLLLTSSLLVLVWAFNQVLDILTPLFVAIGLAYIFTPAAQWLAGKRGKWRPVRLPMPLVSLLLTLAIVVFLGFLGAETGSLLVNQADQLASLVTESASSVEQKLAESLPEGDVATAIVEGVVHAMEEMASRVPDFSRMLIDKLGTAAASAFGVLLTLLFFYYLIKDHDKFIPTFRERYLPDSVNRFLSERIGRINRILRSFLHGYMITSSIVFVLTLGLLLAFGIRIAFILALLAGILNIVPILGFWITAILILLVALATGNGFLTLFFLWAGLALINVLEGNFLQPRIVGRKVGLHPVVVILSIGVFGKLLGVVGVLLGIPLAAILSREWELFLERSRHHRSQQREGG
jgi:predicted PurR-regulated permease PerM